MRAIQFSEYGGPEVLELVEVEDPQPAAGQVRVRVRAVGVNPADFKIRRGTLGGGALPRRTGLEVAGVVDQVGAQVTGVSVGEEVFGPAPGAAAELALMSEWEPIPPSLGFVGAAALPIAVETALRCLDIVRAGAGETVLVNGASGAVGAAAVQFARERGARVIGTASERNHDYVRSLGAEPTVYGEGLEERVRGLTGDGVDAAVDASGGGMLPALVALASGPERVVTIADGEGAQQTGVRYTVGLGSEPRATYAFHLAAELIEAGRFSLPVAQTFPLEQIAEAHRLLESGHPPGKIVLTVE